MKKCDNCGRTEGVKSVKRGQMGKINLCAFCRGDKRNKKVSAKIAHVRVYGH